MTGGIVQTLAGRSKIDEKNDPVEEVCSFDSLGDVATEGSLDGAMAFNGLLGSSAFESCFVATVIKNFLILSNGLKAIT